MTHIRFDYRETTSRYLCVNIKSCCCSRLLICEKKGENVHGKRINVCLYAHCTLNFKRWQISNILSWYPQDGLVIVLMIKKNRVECRKRQITAPDTNDYELVFLWVLCRKCGCVMALFRHMRHHSVETYSYFIFPSLSASIMIMRPEYNSQSSRPSFTSVFSHQKYYQG